MKMTKPASEYRPVWNEDVIATRTEIHLAAYEWQAFDAVVAKTLSAAHRMPCVTQLIADGLSYDLNVACVEAERLVDLDVIPNAAFSLKRLNLPTTYREFNAYLPNGKLDLSSCEVATRQVAQGVEQLLMFGDGTTKLHGLLTHPNRLRRQITHPTVPTWRPNQLLAEVHQLLDLCRVDCLYGPYRLYHGPRWDRWLDDDYNPNLTVRQRLLQLSGLDSIQCHPTLADMSLVLVQKTPDVIRIVIGCLPTVVQNPDTGKLAVAAVMVPQLRARLISSISPESVCGVVQGYCLPE